MKKLTALLLALVLLLSLAACGGNNTDENEPADPPVADQQPAGEKEEPAGAEKEEVEEEVKEEQKEEEKEEEKAPAQEPEKEEPVINITASHSDVTFKSAGSSFQLTAGDMPASFTAAYASADETVAAVAEDGTVTAVAPGTTTVTMTVTATDGQTFAFPCIIRCSWESGAAGADLAAYFGDFMASLGEGNAPFMAEMNAELIDAYYPGLNAVERSQTVMQMAGMSAVAFEFALVECANASDVDAVKAIFEARKTAQVDGGAWYPETIAAWEKAEIITHGNVVALIVAGEQQSAAVEAFNALF